MIIRRYVVKDMAEAVVQIRRELGKDAVILNTKRVTSKRWLGLRKEQQLEVLAATGDDIPLTVSSRSGASAAPPGAGAAEGGKGRRPPAPLRASPDLGEEAALAEVLSGSNHSWAAKPPGTRWESERDRLQALLSTAAGVQQSPRAAAGMHAPDERGAAERLGIGSQAVLADVWRELADVKRLLQATFAGSAAPLRQLVQQLAGQGVHTEQIWPLLWANGPAGEGLGLPAGDGAGAPRAEEWQTWLQQRILDRLAHLRQAQPLAPATRIAALVGPTGVGKTTTVAKLAALHVLAGQRKVGLVTTDTYRIAAVDQLRTYANILGVPLQVVYEPGDLPGALAALSDRDLILVDTAGRNFRMDVHVREMKDLLSAMPVDETYLVLSMTTKPDDLDAVTAAFLHLPVHKFLFTKLDETSSYGAILNLLFKYGLPLSYVTAGQNVPDDLEVADLEKLLRLVIGGAA
ncbi:MAG: flagellar biosynthesis protein FlhF [Alicyclobacillus sp.]|nr:flagellar biosynthesis protein FlhF [Alicyclobacillus sp.]